MRSNPQMDVAEEETPIITLTGKHVGDELMGTPRSQIPQPVFGRASDLPTHSKSSFPSDDETGMDEQPETVPPTDLAEDQDGRPTPTKPDPEATDGTHELDLEQEPFAKSTISLGSDLDTSGTEGRGRRHQQRTKRLMREAQSRFTTGNGITYITDEHWTTYRDFVVNCHLYVSLEMDNAIFKDAAKALSKGENAPHARRSLTMAKGGTANTPGVSAMQAGNLPPRMRIQNELLHTDMAGIAQKAFGGSYLDHDHAAPYRGIIPLEQEFRKRHEELEDEFAVLARENPNEPAVRRLDSYLPISLSYHISNHFPGAYRPKEEVLKAEINYPRILLDGYRALIHLFDTDLYGLVESYRQIQAGTADKLPFSHLWFLFKPGQEIITERPKYQAYRVLQATGGRKAIGPRGEKGTGQRSVSDLVVDCFRLDYDGISVGPVPATISIRPYQGTRSITDLPTYPLRWSKDTVHVEKEEKSLSEYLEDRGRKFEELVQVSHRRYKGLTLREDQLFESFEEIDGDVMIDFKLAYKNSQRPRIPMPELGSGIITTPTTEDPAETRDSGLSYDHYDYFRLKLAYWAQNTELLRNRDPGAMSKDSLILLPARVYGYVLLSRKWYPLDIDLVYPVPKVIPGENDGFGNLVLPPGHKEIVRALIQTHARNLDADGAISKANSERGFDLVKGKGRGLIILLHGAPGVGKTSTAECVAANAGKPLFPITCGDIGGESAQEVEDNLDKFFDLARKWNCVLLLDEADVFLSARVAGNIAQNSLVSVFLRVLEYYPGILILTTNRVGTFDEAIKSRVHCALYYPKLTERRTFRVWQMNIQTLKDRNNDLDDSQKVRFDEEEIEEFARWHWKKGERANRWNGRQIKNAFQTAIALAHWDNLEDEKSHTGPELKATHFRKVSKASMHFDKYLSKTRRDDDTIAKELSIRDDMPDEFQLESDSEDEEPKKSKRKTSKTDKKKTATKEKKRVESKSRSKSKSKPKKKRPSAPSSESSLDEESSEGSSGNERVSESSDESK